MKNTGLSKFDSDEKICPGSFGFHLSKFGFFAQ